MRSEAASLGIVDARARPPIEAFLEDRTYTNPARTMANVRARGWTPTVTMEEPTLDAFFAEAEDAGICQVGIPARAPNKWWGGKGNDLVFEARDQRPGTVFVYAAVDPSLAGAADTIAGLNERGAKGIVFEPGICEVPTYLDDPMINPCYEACQAAGLPALIMGGGETGPDISFSDPRRIDTVAGRFPDLTIVNVHGGWPYVQEAVGVAFRRQNVWMLPDVYFPGLPGEQDYLLAMQTYLQDRFLFATGYPFCPISETLDRVLAAGVPDDILTKVLRDNAVSLFELEVA
jgi:predicted TIM-barrel fold metal-dependent hydrolase